MNGPVEVQKKGRQTSRLLNGENGAVVETRAHDARSPRGVASCFVVRGGSGDSGNDPLSYTCLKTNER